jgi:hypothetical protein
MGGFDRPLWGSTAGGIVKGYRSREWKHTGRVVRDTYIGSGGR